MNIGASDLVLEIGSGNNPRPRADVLCDKFIEDDTERGGRIVRDRPLVEGDAQRLPFRDGSFGYVIASQVLEHVEDPEAMLRELMRVASRGYIETPSEIAERLYGWPFHRSAINLIGGKLVIRPKTFVSPFGELFHVLAARDPQFRHFHLTHNRLLLVEYEWSGTIDYEIVPADSQPLDLQSPQVVEALWGRLAESSPGSRWMPVLKGLVPRPIASWGKSLLARSRPRPRVDLRDIVVCPKCRGAVGWGPEAISCASCRVDYPIVRGIPRLSVEP